MNFKDYLNQFHYFVCEETESQLNNLAVMSGCDVSESVVQRGLESGLFPFQRSFYWSWNKLPQITQRHKPIALATSYCRNSVSQQYISVVLAFL